MRIKVGLKALNRVLRWTGWRIYVEMNKDFLETGQGKPETKIGLIWYGWKFIKELDKDLV